MKWFRRSKKLRETGTHGMHSLKANIKSFYHENSDWKQKM